MRFRLLMVMLIGFPVSMATAAPRAVRPDATVDLRDDRSARVVEASWKYADAAIVPAELRKADGTVLPTHDIAPKAGAAEFDDASWEIIPASSLETRRGPGRLSFAWYRLKLKLPEAIGTTKLRASTVVFETAVDDYAELHVNGRLPLTLGSNPQLAAGWNAPNRIVLTRDARPGDVFTLAIFTANGPLSDPPANHIWIRSATLDVYAPGRLAVGEPVKTEIVRFDPALDAIIDPAAQAEKLAEGFGFGEGPVWFDDALLFSDPNNNRIYRFSDTQGVSVFRTHSGYTGVDIGEYRQPGSNGLAVDREGRLTICEHGNRRITRLEKNGSITVLADRFEGKRLNSPNDLVYRSDDTLFFTDPIFGLPKFGDDPRRESPHTGVYALNDGELRLIVSELSGPNGVALSPDEKHLYVANWDDKSKIIRRYDLAADGSVGGGVTFADFGDQPGEEALDGLKIDQAGNVYVSAPGGLWILDRAGKRLGIVKTPELPANFAWGNDGRTLYLTARTGLYRIRLKVGGSGVRQNPRPQLEVGSMEHAR